MIYVVMRRDREWQHVEAVAAFDNHVNASAYADKLSANEKYAFRVDSVHLNPQILSDNS
jgi:hypothetical protein